MNSENLIPFKKGFDSRRQNGRKPGSRNVSTIIKELLDSSLEDISNARIRKLVEKSGSKTIKEAIILGVLEKSIKGDMKSVEWIFNYVDREELKDAPGFFDTNEIKITIVDPKHKDLEK
ncbi:MAG: hypothetical protein IKE41_03690 [Clostridia bacterium]|nr:hypothetical protein [Clostridia bacterium]